LSSDTTSSRDERQEPGLWLWNGRAPLPPSTPQPPSRVQQFVDPIVSALRRGGWMALLGGATLTLLMVVLRSTPPDTPALWDTAAVALEPVPSPIDKHGVIPAPPVEYPDPQLDQAQMPSAQASTLPTRGSEHQLAKKAAHHKSARTERKTHVSADRGSPFSIHGALTPPKPTAGGVVQARGGRRQPDCHRRYTAAAAYWLPPR
jgi:hypothetical protein